MTERTDQGAVRTGWFGAMTGTALVALGMNFELMSGRNLPGIPNWPSYLSISVSTAFFIALAARRHHKTLWFASIAFVVSSSFVAFAMFMRDPYFAMSSSWLPFQTAKVACIVVGLLAPQLWSGLVAISLHVASPLAVLATIDPAVRKHIAFEPSATLAFAFIGIGVLLYRRRRASLEHEIASARAELLATERTARKILAIRDLANTPIQTIEVCCELLRLRSDAESDVVARMQRSLERLRELSELLRAYEGDLEWRNEDASIDAARLLARA